MKILWLGYFFGRLIRLSVVLRSGDSVSKASLSVVSSAALRGTTAHPGRSGHSLSSVSQNLPINLVPQGVKPLSNQFKNFL